ncbi:MAG: hypothetical protein R3B70_26470 [Polyangiaceae bacterium]
MKDVTLPLIPAVTDTSPLGKEVSPDDLMRAVHLESAYLTTGDLWTDAPRAHHVTLEVKWPLAESTVTAQLGLDPNGCTLNDFGDPAGCTKMAVRMLEVSLQRMRLGDPAGLDRRYYAMTARGFPDGCALIVWPDGSRIQLKLPNAVVPLFPRAPR